MSTVSRTCLIYVNKGLFPPDEELDKKTKEFNSWCGFAFVKDGVVTYNMAAEGATAAGVKAMLADPDWVNVDRIVILGKEEDSVKLTPDDDEHPNIQPLILIAEGEGDEEITHCLAFIDGKFDKLANNQAPEGRPYLFAGTYLFPKVNELWEDIGGNMEKFIDRLKRPSFQQDIEQQDPEISVALLTPGDKGFVYYHAGEVHDYPWGFSNVSFGTTDSADPPSTTKPDATKPGKKRFSMAGFGAPAAAAATTATSTDNTSTTDTVLYEGRVPANIIKAEDVRKLYAIFHGHAEPKGWKNDRPWVSILPERVDQAKKNGWELRGAKRVASTTPVSASSKADDPTKQVLTGSDKEKLLKFVAAIDANTRQVISPEEMEKNEKALPTYFENTKHSLEFVRDRYRPDDFGELIKSYPDAAKQLFVNLQYALFRSDQLLEAATQPGAGHGTTASPPKPAAALAKRFSMK